MRTGTNLSVPPEFILRSRRVVTPQGVKPAAVWVKGGSIQEVCPFDQVPAKLPGTSILDVGNMGVMPGLVDTHVHVNEPGRTEWEGFETATRAAAAGGVTTIVDMPLNSIPATTTVEGLRTKKKAARGKAWVDCGFWGGLVPGNAGELKGLLEEGALGFKAFLCDSGVSEFPLARESDLRESLAMLASAGAPLLAHAELCGSEESGGRAGKNPGDPRRYAVFLASRPKGWENEAVRLLAGLCGEYRARIHIVHLSSAEALPVLSGAQKAGLTLTAETCPHYLCLSSEEVPDGATEFKCCPPIREKGNQDALWRGLVEGTIGFIVSDHSPCAPDLKARESGDFLKAWGGIASLQFSLCAVWTEAARRGFSLEDLARWMGSGPADFAGLRSKGRIAPGMDADLVVFDPEGETVPQSSLIHHRHKLTPYAGRRLKGRVERTFLKGELIYDRGVFGSVPKGSLLGRQSRHELHRVG